MKTQTRQGISQVNSNLMSTAHILVRSSLHRYMCTYIQTDIQTDKQTEYQTNGRTEDKMTSTSIYNHKTHRQTSRSNRLRTKGRAEHAGTPTLMHNVDVDISMNPHHSAYIHRSWLSQTYRKYDIELFSRQSYSGK